MNAVGLFAEDWFRRMLSPIIIPKQGPALQPRFETQGEANTELREE